MTYKTKKKKKKNTCTVSTIELLMLKSVQGATYFLWFDEDEPWALLVQKGLEEII